MNYHSCMNTLNLKEKIAILLADGMTESHIAKETGISQPTISRIKYGSQPREAYVRILDSFFEKSKGGN